MSPVSGLQARDKHYEESETHEDDPPHPVSVIMRSMKAIEASRTRSLIRGESSPTAFVTTPEVAIEDERSTTENACLDGEPRNVGPIFRWSDQYVNGTDRSEENVEEHDRENYAGVEPIQPVRRFHPGVAPLHR
jgi:hypothetical protein